MTDWVVEATEDDFDELFVDKQKPVLLDFWASWSGPCQLVATMVADLALRFGEQVTFATCNIDTQPRLAQRFAVETVPTLILFRNGEPVEFFSGLPSPAKVAEGIERILPST